MASPQNRAPLWVLAAELEARFPTGTNYQIALLDSSPDSITITSGSVSGTTITATGHPFVVGQVLSTTATLGSWVAGAIRYVVSRTVNTFQVSSTPGGTPESLTGAAATISDLPFINPIYINPPQAALPAWDEPQNLAALLAKEIPSYDGLGGRPQVQRSTGAKIDRANNRVEIALNRATLDNTGGSNILSFDAVAILTGGSTTPGNLGGTLLGWSLLSSAFLLDQSQVRELAYTVRRAGA